MSLAERLARMEARQTHRFKSIVLTEHKIYGHPITSGVSAYVSGVGPSRVTATRVAAVGIFALGLKKSRGALLVVGGPGWTKTVDVSAKELKAAEAFAAQVNARAALQPVPLLLDPRYAN